MRRYFEWALVLLFAATLAFHANAQFGLTDAVRKQQEVIETLVEIEMRRECSTVLRPDDFVPPDFCKEQPQ